MPSPIKVLYIEDNIANLKVVETLLSQYDQFELIFATSGNLGFELIKHHLPDVILLDIHLPDIEGYQVLKAIQNNARTAGIPVIALSADAMPCDIEKGLNAGFKKYLTKPVDLHGLIETLNEYLPDNNEPQNLSA